MAESTTLQNEKLTRDTFPRNSSDIKQDAEHVAFAHQDKHDYTGHGIAKRKTDMCYRIDVQKNQQSGSQKATVICIKEEDSEFPERFEIPSSKKSLWSHEIADVKDEVTEMETDFPVQPLEFFNSDQCVSAHKTIKTDVQGEVTKNLSELSGKVNTQDKKHRFFQQNISGRKVKEEVMEKDIQYLPNYFNEHNISESFPPQKSVQKNIKSGIAENEEALTRDPKFQISEKRIAKKLNSQLETLNREQGSSVDKIHISNVKGGAVKNETNLPGELRCQIVEMSVSEEKSNAVIEKDEQTDIETEPPDYQINLIKQVFSKDKSHEKTVEELKCIVCYKWFRYKGNLSKHMKMHTKEIKCEICDRVFKRRRGLYKHMNVHTKEKEYKCEICDKIFYTKAPFYHHMDLHTKKIEHKCKICDKSLSSRTGFWEHMNVHTKEKEYKCKFCDKIFYSKGSLYYHMNLYTEKKEYKCKICDKSFSSRLGFSDHMNVHAKEKEYKCEICDKLYYLNRSLTDHLNLHTKKKEYKCEECGKIFYQKSRLTNHLESHTEVTHRTCEVCDKILASKKSLKQHMKIHAKARDGYSSKVQ